VTHTDAHRLGHSWPCVRAPLCACFSFCVCVCARANVRDGGAGEVRRERGGKQGRHAKERCGGCSPAVAPYAPVRLITSSCLLRSATE